MLANSVTSGSTRALPPLSTRRSDLVLIIPLPTERLRGILVLGLISLSAWEQIGQARGRSGSGGAAHSHQPPVGPLSTHRPRPTTHRPPEAGAPEQRQGAAGLASQAAKDVTCCQRWCAARSCADRIGHSLHLDHPLRGELEGVDTCSRGTGRARAAAVRRLFERVAERRLPALDSGAISVCPRRRRRRRRRCRVRGEADAPRRDSSRYLGHSWLRRSSLVE